MKKTILPVLFLLACSYANGQNAVMIPQYSEGGSPYGLKHVFDVRSIETAEMPAFDLEMMRQEDELNDQQKGWWRFAYNHMVSYSMQNSGTVGATADGGRTWRLRIASPGALTLNLGFKNMKLAPGALLYVYNDTRTHYVGGFGQSQVSADGMLGTELIPGEAVIVELYEPAAVAGQSMLEIFQVSHGYRDTESFVKDYGESGSCNMNVNCSDGLPWNNQKRSVVMLVTGGVNGSGFCTGALINNSCNDGKPYVLTANHCGSSGFGTWIFRFNWESATCTNANSTFNSVSGSTSRANRSAADMRLVEMSPVNSATLIATYNGYYAGWNNSPTPSSSAVGIHHPSGDIKKISFDDAPISVTTAMGGETNGCWEVEWDRNTTTEGGSSGSPLFDNNGLIIGQLWGGGASCQSLSSPDYYGRVSQNWNPNGSTSSGQLKAWLDPSTCSAGLVTQVGYDPNAVSLTWDAQILAISSPIATECDGNITPSLTLKNNGTSTITSITINWQSDGGAVTAYNWTGNLASGQSATVTLPAIVMAPGAHSYTATAGSPNGNTDLNLSNNTITVNYTVLSATGLALPFTEGFESVTFPPAGWTRENPDNNVGSALWVRTTTASGYGNSTASALVDQITPSADTDNQLDHLITPYINLTTSSAPLNLTFSVANARYNNNYYDSLIVLITTDCGSSWTRLASYGNNTGANQLATANDNQNLFTPSAAQWATKTISLNAYASQPAVRIMFRLRSGWGNTTYIDDVNISGSGGSLPVAGFTTSDNTVCQGTAVNFTNTSSNATGYSWSFTGGNPASAGTQNASTTYNAAGTYTVTMTASNVNGTSMSTTTVTVYATPSPVVNAAGVNLSTGAFVSYQWFLNGGAIGGANGQNHTALQTGSYHVQVTDGNGCTGSSTAVNVTVPVGLQDEEMDLLWSVFPNPAQDIVYINDLLPGAASTDLQLLNALGQVVFSGSYAASGQKTLSVATLAPGIYTLSVKKGSFQGARKILVIR